MCSPQCIEIVEKAASRRSFLKGSLGVITAAFGAGCSLTSPKTFIGAETKIKSLEFNKIIDLTHPLSPDFPTWGGDTHFTLRTLATREKDGFNVKKWELIEHTGTHIDAPLHFDSKGKSVDQIEPANLFVPLCVIDITHKSSVEADSRLTVDDIKAWEKRYGLLPAGACVAMHSGWSKRASQSSSFRNPDKKGIMHFPGIDPDVANFLISERHVAGVAVDTLSLDYGKSEDFKFHLDWLSSGRWGVECIADLDLLPPAGAHAFIGAPKVAGGTGGLTRVCAFI